VSPIKRLGAVAGAVVVALVAALGATLPASAATAAGPAALGGSGAYGVQAAGGSVSDGTRALTVSRAVGLDPSGSLVTVTGSGYDQTKGIYLAVCVDKGPGAVPTPCIGGVDMTGGSGGSVWISSNPPPYGEGLAKPYGTGGTFSVPLAVVAADPITGTDCRVTACAVITRNDHTRPQDRSQDLRIPISFATAVPSTSAKTTTTAVTGTKAPATSKESTSKAVTSTLARTSASKVAPSTTSRPAAPASTTSASNNAKPVTITPAPATSSDAPATASAAVTDSPDSTPTGASAVAPAPPDESTISSLTTDNSAPAMASGVAGNDAGNSSPASQLGGAPIRTDAVQPAANATDSSGFPVLAVALIAIIVAVPAAGGFLLSRRQRR